jgi:hypothetical protein
MAAAHAVGIVERERILPVPQSNGHTAVCQRQLSIGVLMPTNPLRRTVPIKARTVT